MKSDKEINLDERIKKNQRNIGIFLIGLGIFNILLGISSILKKFEIEGILNISVGLFVIYIVIKDRRKTKKEGEINE